MAEFTDAQVQVMRTALLRNGYLAMAGTLGTPGGAEDANCYLSTHAEMLTEGEAVALWPHAAISCENCGGQFVARPPEYMADLNNLCMTCACECAAQLEIDYNLPSGCSDKVRVAAMRDPRPGQTVFTMRCNTRTCSRRGRMFQRFERTDDNCYGCGTPAFLLGTYTEPQQ